MTSVAELFSIEEKSENPHQIMLNLKGELDVDGSPQLLRTLKRCFEKEPEQITVRMDEVTDMDSSGLATLIEGLRWSKGAGSRFSLSGVHDAVRDLIELSKLGDEFEILSGSKDQSHE